VDGFAPYSQDVVLEKLMKNLKHEGVLYIIGMTPVEDVPREQSDQYRTGIIYLQDRAVIECIELVIVCFDKE